jgi:hypothetical protein
MPARLTIHPPEGMTFRVESGVIHLVSVRDWPRYQVVVKERNDAEHDDETAPPNDGDPQPTVGAAPEGPLPDYPLPDVSVQIVRPRGVSEALLASAECASSTSDLVHVLARARSEHGYAPRYGRLATPHPLSVVEMVDAWRGLPGGDFVVGFEPYDVG